MTKLRIFDPPMCCSTGICGPSVDPALVRFAADVEWLASQGVVVERFNLAQDPAAFVAEPLVKDLMVEHGDGALPATLLGASLVCFGAYPSRDELAASVGLAAEGSLFTPAVAELVAIGAAIASGCEPCFRFHYGQARRLGVSREDMRLAVGVAQGVKAAPARSITELADKYLAQPSAGAEPTDDEEASDEGAAQSCCSPAADMATAPASDGRCC